MYFHDKYQVAVFGAQMFVLLFIMESTTPGILSRRSYLRLPSRVCMIAELPARWVCGIESVYCDAVSGTSCGVSILVNQSQAKRLLYWGN